MTVQEIVEYERERERKRRRRDPAPLPHATGLAREPERASITGVKTSQWYHLQREGKAPLPIKIGLRTVAWRRADLHEWIEAQTKSA